LAKSKIHIEDYEMTAVISGCCQNDRHSQERLYRHFFPIMNRMVIKYTTDHDQLIDILNNGFLKVFKKIDTFQHKGSFEGWVRRLIFHSLSDYFRSKKSDIRFLLFEENYDLKERPNTQMYYDDLITLIRQLPEKHMKVFRLYAIDGYKHKEIGQQLGISENTSKWYLSEARKILQKKITQQDTQHDRYAQ